MRITLFRSFALTATVLAFAGHADAQVASNANTALQRGGATLTDPLNDSGGSGQDDVFGDNASPPVFIGSDGAFLYFRIRVNGNPIGNGGTNFKNNTGYACAIDVNGTLGSYEYLSSLTGGPAPTMRWIYNTPGTASDSVADNADTVVSSVAAALGQATFVSGTQYFVTWWIPWSVITAGGGAAPALPLGTSLRFACGTTSSGLNIALDPVAGATAAPILSNMWSTPYVCGSTGCLLDTDGDSVPDSVESSLGSDPLLADSDGDGIPDNVELTPPGGGAFAAVNTDGNGLIDARDTDSDNDCVPDSHPTEGVANYRNNALPAVGGSLFCTATSAAAPICDTNNGTCIGCDANFSGGTAASCYASSTPACQLSGGLAGRCTQCKAGLTTLCVNATPACNVTTGACAACNGDNGSAANSACPSALAPACQPGGGLMGQCTVCSATNTSLCVPAAPACDPANGTCSTCNGDRNGGTTKGCPDVASPYCTLGAGTCGKCTSNAQCGDGHAGPTCDLLTGACVDKDSDGDGLNDSVEKVLGTDFEKADTDGDGIDDLTEVTLIAQGAPSKLDTDNDGTIDAKDTDSDNDGILDAVEGKTDLDGDGLGNFRDTDDDGDGISTKEEIRLADLGKVSDDVDGDGKKNYYDTDADADGKGDAFEGSGDDDADGIANFLDVDDKTVKPFDAGAPIAPGPTNPNVPGGPSSSSGAAPAQDDGVAEGSGFACSTTGSGSPGVVLGVLVALGLAMTRRRRSR